MVGVHLLLPIHHAHYTDDDGKSLSIPSLWLSTLLLLLLPRIAVVLFLVDDRHRSVSVVMRHVLPDGRFPHRTNRYALERDRRGHISTYSILYPWILFDYMKCYNTVGHVVVPVGRGAIYGYCTNVFSRQPVHDGFLISRYYYYYYYYGG